MVPAMTGMSDYMSCVSEHMVAGADPDDPKKYMLKIPHPGSRNSSSSSSSSSGSSGSSSSSSSGSSSSGSSSSGSSSSGSSGSSGSSSSDVKTDDDSTDEFPSVDSEKGRKAMKGKTLLGIDGGTAAFWREHVCLCLSR